MSTKAESGRGGDLGKALALLRVRAGIATQEELAERLGISSQSVSSREAGGDAKFSTIARTLEVMGATLADLERALREVRGEPPINGAAHEGRAPAEAQAITAPMWEDERVRREVDRRVAEILATIVREMGRSGGETGSANSGS